MKKKKREPSAANVSKQNDSEHSSIYCLLVTLSPFLFDIFFMAWRGKVSMYVRMYVCTYVWRMETT
jgi:hypothetical protein